jgi:flagellar motor switch protein FliM
MGVSGALQLDLKLAFPIIDLLLGGEGKGGTASREITEIEEEILGSVAGVICRELGLAWQAVLLKVTFDQRVGVAEAQRLLPPEEKVLSLSFEITLPDARGGLNLAVPAAASNALLRKISASWSYRQPRGQADARRRLMKRLQDCPFIAELGAEGLRLVLGEMTGLVSGRELRFDRSSSEPASLLVAGVEMFRAVPARQGNTRLAMLMQRPPSAESEGNSPE